MKFQTFLLEKRKRTIEKDIIVDNKTRTDKNTTFSSQKLDIYIIPGTGSFWFKYNSQYLGAVELSVYDKNGESIFIECEKKDKIEINRVIDIGLNRGIYMLQIHHSNQTISKQIDIY